MMVTNVTTQKNVYDIMLNERAEFKLHLCCRYIIYVCTNIGMEREYGKIKLDV